MKIPKAPKLLEKQRTSGRFFETSEMMDILSVYYGCRNQLYARTWQYRTLIAVHREQGAKSTLRKAYGADWKGLRKYVDINGNARWTEEGCICIKRDVIEYTQSGKLPLIALQRGAEFIRTEEMHALRSEKTIASRVRALLR